MSKAPIGTTASTGQKCPESGVWKVVGTPSTTAPIAKGNVMPPYAGLLSLPYKFRKGKLNGCIYQRNREVFTKRQ